MFKDLTRYLFAMWRDGLVADVTYKVGRQGLVRFVLWIAQGCLAMASVSGLESLSGPLHMVHHHLTTFVLYIGS